MESTRKRKRYLPAIFSAGLFVCAMLGASGALASLTLVDYQIDVDGSPEHFFYDGLDALGIETANGLGDFSLTVSGEGSHSVVGFFDFDIGSVFFDESGYAFGGLGADQSWEIDDPDFGDIFDKLQILPPDDPLALDLIDPLDNTNAVPAGSENDVSMAIGWDFWLASDQLATVTFSLFTATSDPTSGFYLKQSDPDFNESLYFTSTLTTPSPVPLPAAGWLMLSAIVGLGFTRRKAKA